MSGGPASGREPLRLADNQVAATMPDAEIPRSAEAAGAGGAREEFERHTFVGPRRIERLDIARTHLGRRLHLRFLPRLVQPFRIELLPEAFALGVAHHHDIAQPLAVAV